MNLTELAAELRKVAETRYTPQNDGCTEHYMAAERAMLEAAAQVLTAIQAERDN